MTPEWKVADMEAARLALRRGEMTVTLVATEGERFRLRDIGTLCTSTEGLMRAIAKGIAPTERVEWIITAVASGSPTPSMRRSSGR